MDYGQETKILYVVRDNSGLSVQSGLYVFLIWLDVKTIVFTDVFVWFIWVFDIALITGGLMVTFKDKKPNDEKGKKL